MTDQQIRQILRTFDMIDDLSDYPLFDVIERMFAHHDINRASFPIPGGHIDLIQVMDAPGWGGAGSTESCLAPSGELETHLL